MIIPIIFPPNKRPRRLTSFQKRLAIILIIVVAVVAILGVSGFIPVVKKPVTPTNIVPETSIVIEGTVVENNMKCAADDACILVIQTADGKKINAYYGGGLTPNGACYRNEGLRFVQGDRVELFGKFTDQNNFSLCEPGSYIHKE